MMREDRIRRMPMALSALVALALAVLPAAVGARCVSPGFPGAGGPLLVDRVAARRRARAGVLRGPRARRDQGVVLGQHALALTLMAAWATHLRLRLRVFSMLSQSLTDLCAADRLSVHVVLGGRRHRQPGDELRPLARAGDRRGDLAPAAGTLSRLRER